MRAALSFLAGRRWAGVGLALVAELVLLVGLSLAPPSATIGIPAAVAAAIAGTVAVVFGVVDGVAVATIGAIAFALLGGWAAGEIAAIGVWPTIVAAVGLFARRVERHRIALRSLVEAHESERRALALTLHDDSAQTLTGALLALRSALSTSDVKSGSVQAGQARDLIADTIRQLRQIARELSPRALEDYGLGVALDQLAESEGTAGEPSVSVERDWHGRLSVEAERTLYRFAQTALAVARDRNARGITIRLTRERDQVLLTVAGELPTVGAPPQVPASLEERVRLLDGRVSAAVIGTGELVLAAEVPAEPHQVEPAERVA